MIDLNKINKKLNKCIKYIILQIIYLDTGHLHFWPVYFYVKFGLEKCECLWYNICAIQIYSVQNYNLRRLTNKLERRKL